MRCQNKYKMGGCITRDGAVGTVYDGPVDTGHGDTSDAGPNNLSTNVRWWKEVCRTVSSATT